MSELRRDYYNRNRYHIMWAVTVLNSTGCIANFNYIHRITKIKKDSLKKHLNKMSGIELIRKEDPKRTSHCIFKFKLSAHGKRLFERYQERHDRGETLRLKWDVPFKVDYSDFELLPGLKDHEQDK